MNIKMLKWTLGQTLNVSPTGDKKQQWDTHSVFIIFIRDTTVTSLHITRRSCLWYYYFNEEQELF